MRAMTHDDYETQLPRAARSSIGEHIFEAKQQKTEDSHIKAAHEKQERSWATNAMGMHIGIDDAEADESVNSKDNLKRRQKQHLSSDVSQRWASSILMMFKAFKFWQNLYSLYLKDSSTGFPSPRYPYDDFADF